MLAEKSTQNTPTFVFGTFPSFHHLGAKTSAFCGGQVDYITLHWQCTIKSVQFNQGAL